MVKARRDLRILIADDEALARRRLLRLLGELPGVEIAGECSRGAEVLEVARHGGLSGGDAFAGQEVHELGLVGDGVAGHQFGDGLLALNLGRHQRTPRRNAISPRAACMRLWAWRMTWLCGPSMTSAATS